MSSAAKTTAPDAVRAFRETYRENEIGPLYRGWAHFAFTSVGSLGVLVFAVTRVHAVRPLEWLTLPAAFVLANLAEYFGHKGPMHHPRKPLTLLFQRHTREHHRFFTNEAMAYESSRDFKMVLFPPVMLLFFLGGIATPIAGALFLVASANVAWLFVSVAITYFLTYEWLHFAYHLDDRSWLGGSPLLAALRRHHQRHHDPRLMERWNFNITFPIADWIFKTSYREPAAGDAANQAPDPLARP